MGVLERLSRVGIKARHLIEAGAALGNQAAGIALVISWRREGQSIQLVDVLVLQAALAGFVSIPGVILIDGLAKMWDIKAVLEARDKARQTNGFGQR